MSGFLVDTQLLLWSASGSRKVPAAVALTRLPAVHADPFDRIEVIGK